MSTIAAGTTTGTALVNTGDTSGQLVLQTNGTTTAVTIGTNQVVTLAQPLPVNSGGMGVASLTANNVILGNGTSAVQFVAPGTNGNVLTSNGTTWTSAAPVTGALVYLSSTTASAVSSVDIETGISSTYDDYIIICDNLTQPSASNTYFYIQYKVGGTYRTSSYKYQLEYTDTAIASQYNEVASTVPFTSGVKVAAYAYAANAGSFFNVEMTLRSVNTAGSYPIVCTQVTGYSATDRGRNNYSYGLTEAATGTLSGIRFLTASGTISGVFKLYGIAKS